jgi:dTDP-4-dehydrorhamnose reductase
MSMKKALIGFSGFVGSNLLRQTEFGYLYNRNNVIDSQNEEFDLVVCAAPSAEKWRANKEPERDTDEVNNLMNSIKNINTNHFVLISTVDVYKNPSNVYEDTPMELNGLHPYGKNRYLIEEFVRHNFVNHLIVRLPALFGCGLKKNFLFDLIHSNCLDLTDHDSEFQFYSLARLWADINIALHNSINTMNITSEPISAHEIALCCFNFDFNNKTTKPLAKYNVKSRYDYLFGGEKGYMYGKDAIIRDICEFVKSNCL